MRIIFLLFLTLFFKTEAQTSVLNIADSLFLNGNYAKAINYYKIHKNQDEVFEKIAKAYVAIGNYNLALSNFQAANEAYPGNILLKYEFAKLLSKTKNFETALVIYKTLISIHGNNPNYHYELGLVQEHIKDSLAIKSFTKAFNLDNTHQKAIYKVAKYNLQKRRYTTVDSLISIGLETYPKNIELINLKAQKYRPRKYFKKK